MTTTPDDATTAYYRSMARNMVPAIYDLFFLFSQKYNLNPYRAYMIGKFATDDETLVNKPENQVLDLKHFDDKSIVEPASEKMNAEELSQNKEEYDFVGTIMPMFAGSIIDHAKHLGQKITDMYFVVTLVKPEGQETYLRIQMKCYKRKDWNMVLIDGKI